MLSEEPDTPIELQKTTDVKSMLANEKGYVESIYSINNLVTKVSLHEKKSALTQATVLPSKCTELVGCFYQPSTLKVFTVDVNCLVRMWCLRSGECLRSYPLELEPDQQATLAMEKGTLAAFAS